jgi:lantibiotic modifying enzyme
MTGPVDRADLQAAAQDIIRSLESSAIPTGAGLSWRAEILVDVEGGTPMIARGDVGPALYDGTAGIAVALAAAGAVEVARPAVEYALAAAEELRSYGRLGLFDGATGIAVAAMQVGRAAGADTLCQQAVVLARDIARSVGVLVSRRPATVGFDLMGGLSGTVLGLLGLADSLADAELLASLTEVGHWLADAAEPQVWGSAWPAGGVGPPLLGLAHGAAGVVLALGELAARTGDARLADAAREGQEYERGWYDPDKVAWPDLRKIEAGADPSNWMAAWCHGALGIGLSRLRLHALAGNSLVQAEVSAALQAARDLVIAAGTSWRNGTAADCSACHGLAGVVELLLVAAKALEVEDHARAARRVADLMLRQRHSAQAWPCGLPGAGEVPGLMTGTAGIALTLLRAAGATDLPTPLLPGPARW